jgi:hypothetical protein
MASSRSCHLTTRLAEASNSYWLSNRGLKKRPGETPLAKLLIRALSFNPITARLWLSYPVRRGLRVYPYMWLPFLFDRLLRQDPRCRQIWRETREISNRLPSGLQFSGLLEPLTERAGGRSTTKSARSISSTGATTQPTPRGTRGPCCTICSSKAARRNLF